MGEYDIYMKEKPQVPNWVVTEAQPHEDYTITVTFADGSKRLFDMSSRLDYECFRPLKDIDFFMKARAMYDSVAWSNTIDIAPETLYNESVNLK